MLRPTPAPPSIALPPEVERRMEEVRAREADLVVPERLMKPHKVIAAWLAEHEEEKRRARAERDPWRRSFPPSPFTDMDLRRHRLLDALFKALERQGGKVEQGERGALSVKILGEQVEFQLREKHEQERRPLTEHEELWRSRIGGKDWKMELKPTGCFVFEIKDWSWPSRLERLWRESDKRSMEGMLPEILTAFVAAGPLMVQRRKEREEEARERERAEWLRQEERRRLKRDANRWRRFREMALDWRELAAVRDFLAALRALEAEAAPEIDGRSVVEWIAWAEDWLRRSDPTAGGLEGVFAQIAEVTDQSDRD